MKYNIFSRRFSIAPMMKKTDRHCRYFHRQFSSNILLYTEMISTKSILYGKIDPLFYDEKEHPVALQLGGNNPFELAKCAKIGENLGYDEINLNVGCPSHRAYKGLFGVYLMTQKKLLSDCLNAILDVVNIPVTIKTRIGIDNSDSYEFLRDFIGTVFHNTSCSTFIIHARKACCSGMNTKKNRSIPPLNYSHVYRIKKDFPNLSFTVNGGIKTIQEAKIHLQYLDGVMMGRAVYYNPNILFEVDHEIFGEKIKLVNLPKILRSMYPYIESELKKGIYLDNVTRHMLWLFKDKPNSRKLRNDIIKNACKPNAGIFLLEEIIASMG